MKNKDKETDFCYYCGHRLGEHRMSGKCDKVVIADPKLKDFRFVVCGCRHYQIKKEEEDEEKYD